LTDHLGFVVSFKDDKLIDHDGADHIFVKSNRLAYQVFHLYLAFPIAAAISSVYDNLKWPEAQTSPLQLAVCFFYQTKHPPYDWILLHDSYGKKQKQPFNSSMDSVALV